ncbi:TolC family protein [Algoriphagus lutimaris]|uniref:TolC family protein n=1 Tax=Algoriphagus lutimaris TaxID=613197 RepID=UPI00196A76DB|nr:TolC family protein [Algoriphagus lutimaris]MBN3518943.1 TolC family protein [Algoriphagus lutimaris]
MKSSYKKIENDRNLLNAKFNVTKNTSFKQIKNWTIAFLLAIFTGFHSFGQSLDDYLKIAAENNPGLKGSYKEFEAALQKAAQIRSLPDPTISFGYFISPVETRVGPQRARLSLNQMFPWFGTLKYYGTGSEAMAEAKFQAFTDAKNKLYFKVISAYYPLYELNKFIEIEEQNIEILKNYKTLATSQFSNGNGAMVDVLRVDIMLKDAETNLGILEKQRTPLVTRFNNLLNREENEPVEVVNELEEILVQENYRRDSLLENNPTLQEFDFKIKASHANEMTAASQGKPKIGVGLDYVIIGKREDMMVDDNGKNALMPMVSMSLPIFSGKYQAAKKEAKLMQEAYQYQKEEFENDLLSTYDQLDFQVSKQHDLIILYEEQIKQTQQSLELLYTAYSNSGKSFEDVLQMQQQLLKYQKLKVSAETALQINIAEIDYITAKTLDQ